MDSVGQYLIVGVAVFGLAPLTGFLHERYDPVDSTCLILSDKLVKMEERGLNYYQFAGILLPKGLDFLKTTSLYLSIFVIVLAFLTAWWIIFPAIAMRLITAFVTRKLTNRSFRDNAEIVVNGLKKEETKYRNKADSHMADGLAKTIQQIGSLIPAEELDFNVPRKIRVDMMINSPKS